jgi:Fic family protein
MEMEKFNGKAGRFEKWVMHGTEIHSYVPNELPSEIKFDNGLINSLSRATYKIGELSGMGLRLPDPNLLIIPYVKREALMSSRIEGTKMTVSEMYKSEAEEKTEDMDSTEVRNYVSALKQALESKEEKITLETLKKMHAILMSGGVRGHEKNPGEFRKIQNFISLTNRIGEASYIPPPPHMVPDLMKSLENYVNSENATPLIQVALAHYQFETIHPFCDGNGRIGRTLVTLMLCKKNVLSQPLLYLSAYFEKFRKEYENLLLKVNQEGCYEEWVRFFLSGVESQSEDAIQRTKRLFGIRDEYIKKLREQPKAGRAAGLIDQLFYNPFINIPGVAKNLAVTYPTAKKITEQFLRAGILVEADKKQRNKLYCAEEILRELET